MKKVIDVEEEAGGKPAIVGSNIEYKFVITSLLDALKVSYILIIQYFVKTSNSTIVKSCS